MSKLTDLLHSWAVKPGHYDDDFPGGLGGGLPTGMTYELFTVENLFIPSGTDWHSAAHVIGEFSVRPVGGLLVDLYIETVAAAPDGDLAISVAGAGWGATNGIVSLGLTNTKVWAATNTPNVTDLAWETGDQTVAQPASMDFEVRLYSSPGALTGDRTVALARAAILIF